MPDELFKLLATIIETLMTVGVGFILRTTSRIGTEQQAQAISIAEMKGTLTGIVGSVNRLHEWRNKLQEREFEDMAGQIDQLKEQLRIKDV